MVASMTLGVNTLKKYVSDLFFESGTHKGGGVQAALDAGFGNIISVEVHKPFYDISCQLYGGNEKVKLILGDSIDVMAGALADFDGKITFWLDGHVEPGAVTGRLEVPILIELDIIKSLKRNDHTIMIDDRRVMGWYKGWAGITENDVIRKVKEINQSYTILYEDSRLAKKDIIVATL